MLRTSAIGALSSLAIAAVLACAPAANARGQIRGTTTEPSSAAPSAGGKYYALVIGIDDYPTPLPKLKTAVNDARAVSKVLSESYSFDVKLLVNGDASREHILDSLNQYENTLTANDSLLIYFAGHGYENKITGKAYWLPVDAGSVNSSNRIIADDITSEMVALSARHILVISDSCYSGGLSRDADVVSATLGKDALLRRMMSGRSRTLMASGGDEPVSDSGKEGHSAFAYALLEALNSRQEPVFTAGDLFYSGVQRRVAGNTEQVPHYDVIRSSGHEDGDFVFLRKGAPSAETSSLFQPQGAALDDLVAARATYYTPSSNGLRSFHCSVSSDWKKLLTASSGAEVPDSSPLLVYLNGLKLSVQDDVKTTGTLDWKESAPPAAEITDKVGRFHEGIQDMLVGFLQTWNGFMNGSMVPQPDSTTTVTRSGDGVHLHASADGTVVDEGFDKTLLLTDYHLVTREMDVLMYPTYMQTDDGKVMSSVRSLYRVTNAPGTELTMSVSYNMVDSFRLPATLLIDEKNVGKFEFTFSDCTVTRF